MRAVLRAAWLAGVLLLPGCSGLTLFNGAPREVLHDTGPLTVPPPLRDAVRR